MNLLLIEEFSTESMQQNKIYYSSDPASFIDAHAIPVFGRNRQSCWIDIYTLMDRLSTTGRSIETYIRMLGYTRSHRYAYTVLEIGLCDKNVFFIQLKK